MSLIRDALPMLNGGQFLELLPLFTDEQKRLFFFMTVEQAVTYREAIVKEDGTLLMQIFLGELAATQPEGESGRPSKLRKTARDAGWEGDEDTMAPSPKKLAKKELVPEITFNPEPQQVQKHYGLTKDETSKALQSQLTRYMVHMTKPINLDRKGAPIRATTVDEQQATFRRFAGYLVRVKGAELAHISVQHVLVVDWVVNYYEWLDCMRGSAPGNCRKVIQHLLALATFVLVLFPGLQSEYASVPDVYRRLAAQLNAIEKQQAMTQSDLIREGLWLPFPIIVKLATNRVEVLKEAIASGASREDCAVRALEAVVIMLLSRRNWRSTELTSLELVSERELDGLVRSARAKHRSAYLEKCGRNFIVRTAAEKWVVLTNVFKTVGSQRHVEDTLLPVEAEVMDLYAGYRRVLLGPREHKFAFVISGGRRLTGSDIADMFERLAGVRLLCNVRRKSMITWALAQPNIDRESFARLCRHSKAQQRRVYDQRTNDVRTGPALDAVEELAASLNGSNVADVETAF